jgi:hypothetical protein
MDHNTACLVTPVTLAIAGMILFAAADKSC